MLFDYYHIGYLTFAFAFVIASLIILGKYVKKEKHKTLVLKVITVSTFVIHISILWAIFFRSGSVKVPINILFPIYFCNVVMYAQLIAAFLKNKESKIFYYIACFAGYGGVLGALITLFYPESYIYSKSLFLWDTMKSLLSHTTMLLGSLYIFVGGFVKIKVKNIIPVIVGLLFCGLVGVSLNSLFAHMEISYVNSMYFLAPAIKGLSWTMGWWIALYFVIIVFCFTAIWEMFTLQPKERWYYKLHKQSKKKFDKIYK